jgi:hypothetical protein
MATTTGKSHRQGAVTGRSQFRQAGGGWQTRDERNGRFLEQSASKPLKGVAREPDGRDTARDGTAKDRVQIKNPITGRWIKVDTSTGRIIDEKRSEGPYKGIAIRPSANQKN